MTSFPPAGPTGDHELLAAECVLGSVSDADDAVQECWLRLSNSSSNAIVAIDLIADPDKLGRPLR